MPQSPRTLKPSSAFSPQSIPGLALWLDASQAGDLYTTDAGPVTAVSAPTDISGCVGWWDASDASTLFAANTGSTLATTTVGRWANKGTLGSAADLLQATPGSRPTTGANTRNGNNVLSFDGVDDWMQRSFTLSQPCTLLIVYSYSSAYASTTTLVDGAGAGNTLRFAPTSSTDGLFATGGSGQLNVGSTVAHNTWKVDAFVANGAASASAARRNGLLVVSGATATATQPNGLTLASWGGSPLQYANAQYAEVIVFNSALVLSDIARVEAYLAAKWGFAGFHAAASNTSDPVGYWRDRSGNGRHATQSTSGSRPTVSETSLNGRKQLGLVSQHLRGPSMTWNGSVTAYLVGRTGQTANGAFLFHDGAASDQTDAFMVGWLNTQGFGAYGNGWGAGNAPRVESPSAWRNADIVAGVTLSSTEAIARVNGATVNTVAGLTGTLSQATNAQYYIGREAAGTWTNVNGSVAELLIYQPALSPSQRQRIERYLAAKWGITLAPQVSNADAQDWINRVYANGGAVTASTAAAVSAFCDAIDAAAIRDRFYRLNLFCGTGLNACLVPLYRGQSLGGTQYGNTTDTNAGGLFVSNDYAEASGIAAQGTSSTSKYLDTGVLFTSLPTTRHCGVFIPAPAYTTTNAYTYLGAAASAAADGFGIYIQDGGMVAADSASRSYNSVSVTYLLTGGHYAGVTPSGSFTLRRTYRNGTSIGSGGDAAATASANSVYIMAENRGGSPARRNPNGIYGYHFGDVMTQGQLESLRSAFNAFAAAIGRPVV